MIEKFREINRNGDINIKMSDEKGYWRAEKRELITAIRMICETYQNDGYSLTLRQLYYQLVSKDLIPNHDKVYKKLSSLKDDVVYGGLVDWNVFEDRGRIPNVPYCENSIKDALKRTVNWYTLDRQKDQNTHVEVWTEKDAISSILKNVTNPMGVTLVVNKGYTSSTAIYGAYKRFSEAINSGQKVKILYFGDHDPSGLDMIRDINKRLMMMFLNGEDEDLFIDLGEWWSNGGFDVYDVCDLGEKFECVASIGHDCSDKVYELFELGQKTIFFRERDLFEVIQVGLTMDQINEFNPPPNPAKMTDPRAKKYIEKFGQISWEVDALEPKLMEGIVKDAIRENIDLDIYDRVLKEEREDKIKINQIIKDLI